MRTSAACAPVWTSPRRVTAAARKLARLIYSMLTQGEEYTDQGQTYYEEPYRQRVLNKLNKRAQQLGMTLVPTVLSARAGSKIPCASVT